MKSSLLEHYNLLSEGSCCPNTFTRKTQVCQGCSTLLSSAQLSILAGQHGQLPLQCHFFLKRDRRRATEGQETLLEICLQGLQSHTSTMKLSRGWHYTFTSPHQQLAGMILPQVCKVTDRQSDWRRHYKSHTVSLLHLYFALGWV
jgi:hypothetical protein